MRRVLAVAAALGMVALALVVRGALEDRREERSRTYRVVCASDLEAVCATLQESGPRGVEVVREPAGVTADRLVGVEGDPGLDGWLVSAPWPAMVDQVRQGRARPPVFAPDPGPLARSPLVLVVRRDRAAVLGPRCDGGEVGWRCLGEAAGGPSWEAIGGQSTWGAVEPGHAPASTDGTGLLVVGQAVAAFHGRSDLSTADLDGDEFRKWFADLERAIPSGEVSLNRMLTQSGFLDAIGTTEASVRLAGADRRDDLVVLYPAPMATADVVLARVAGEPGEGLADRASRPVRDALVEASWRPADDPDLPSGSGLPSPGLLSALRDRAREVAGR